MAPAAMHGHADVLLNASASRGVAMHGGVDTSALVDVDVCFSTNDDVNAMLHGGADARMLMPVTATVDGIVREDVEERAANPYGGEPINRPLKTDSLVTLNLSLDFLDLRIEDNFTVHRLTPSPLRNSILSRSFTSSSILNLDSTLFPYSPRSFSSPSNINSPFLSTPLFNFPLFKFHFSTSSVQLGHLLMKLAPQIQVSLYSSLLHFSYSQLHNFAIILPICFEDFPSSFELPITALSPTMIIFFHSHLNLELSTSLANSVAIPLHASTYQLFSGSATTTYPYFYLSHSSFSNSQSHNFVFPPLPLPFPEPGCPSTSSLTRVPTVVVLRHHVLQPPYTGTNFEISATTRLLRSNILKAACNAVPLLYSSLSFPRNKFSFHFSPLPILFFY
jgi:hypothetical protein